MLTSKQVNEVIIKFLELQHMIKNNKEFGIDNALKEDPKLELAKLEGFITAHKNSNIFVNAPDVLPENVQMAMQKIEAYKAGLSSEQKNALNQQLIPYRKLSEVYTVNADFVRDMSQLHADAEKHIQLGRQYASDLFEYNPNLAEFLRYGYDMKSPLNISLTDILEGDINAAQAKMQEQFMSAEFTEMMEKIGEIIKNQNWVNAYTSKLSYNMENNFIGSQLGNELIKPIQHGPRYNLLLAEIIGKVGQGDERKLNEEHPLFPVYDMIKTKNLDNNQLQDVGKAHFDSIMNVQDPETIIRNTLTEKRQKGILDKLVDDNGQISRVINQLNKQIESIDKIQTRSSKKKKKLDAQAEGLRDLVQKVEDIKIFYENKNPLSEIKTLHAKLNKAINDVKAVHPQFKADNMVKSLMNQVLEFDKQMMLNLGKNKVLTTKVQYDVVKTMQIEFLDQVIKRLQTNLNRIEHKLANSNQVSDRLQDKQKGLKNIIADFNQMQTDLKQSKQVTYKYGESGFKQKVSAVIEQRQQENPLLRKGFFSHIDATVRDVEKQAWLIEKSVNHAIQDEEYAERVQSKIIAAKMNR